MHPLIPFSALVAEASVFPLVSALAQKLVLLRIERSSPGLLKPDTQRLSADLEASLALRAGGLSLHNLRQLRDQVWFPSVRLGPSDEPQRAERSIALADYVCNLAQSCLEFAGHCVRLRSQDDPARHAEHFRWLSLLVPSDFLVAAASVAAGFVDPPSEHVQIVSPQLREVLAAGCAETHLHMGSAVPFSWLWSGVMAAMAKLPRLPFAALRPPYPCGAVDAQQLEVLLLAAAISRVILAAFLWRKECFDLPGSFADFVCQPEGKSLTALSDDQEREASRHGTSHLRLQTLCDRVASRAGTHLNKAQQTCYAALRHVLYPRTVIGKREEWRAFYAHLTEMPTFQRSLSWSAEDPLQCWLPLAAPGAATIEARFASRGLRYLRSTEGRNDLRFAQLFMQYNRIRFGMYRYLVQHPGVSGLDWFSRHYDRIWVLRQPLQRGLLPIVLELESKDLSLRSLEVRRAPEDSYPKIRNQIRDLAHGALHAYHEDSVVSERPEIGMVFHFVKEYRGRDAHGFYLHADPNTMIYGFRHARWFESRWQQARAIAQALDYHPELLILLRGLDVASRELAQPTWVLLPLFQIVRRASERAAARLAKRQPGWHVPSLRTTVHAGEDFGRLVEGLRRIHEVIEFGLVGMGDRIGHALALGVDPRHAASQAGDVAQALEDRLDDLLWEMTRYEKGDLPADAGRVTFVRGQIMHLSMHQYGTQLTIAELQEARQLRHQPGLLRVMGFPRRGARSTHELPLARAQRILYKYLTDREVFVRGQQSVQVQYTDSEVEFLNKAQRWLVGVFGRLEVTVESNPTSNLLIGGFNDINRLPAFRLSPLPQQKNSKQRNTSVLLSVNTDNPVTFTSCLADELAHVYYGLLREGISAADALAWIDQARQSGYRSRFTLSLSKMPQILRSIL